MAQLPRFHRRKKEVAAPTLITSDLPKGKTTPPPGDLPSGSPMRSLRGLSPFRVFHRSSGKRARDSPPASLPHSPAAVPVLGGDCTDGRPVSPLSLKTDPAGDDGQRAARPPKIPAFLDQSPQEIENKFSELVWRERNRVLQSLNNPSPEFRWARVTGPHLKVLDRYMNIQPWHNNRIKLQVPDGHLDYINASPISLTPSPCPTADGRTGATREPDRYIAMQGPKAASTDHTWRMVVEQLESPGVIVMLTETHEGHQEKCFPYFPRSRDDPPLEINERDEFGDGFRATVRCEGLEETPAGDAIELRKLVIRVHSRPKPTSTSQPPSPPSTSASASPISLNPLSASIPPPPTAPNPAPSSQQSTTTTTTAPTSDPYDLVLYHFLYKKWPDFGVPSLADLDSFFTLMRLSREKNARPSNPRIVHCSAGVGRSGTFIALEHLMRELDAGVLEGWDERAVLGGGVGFPPPPSLLGEAGEEGSVEEQEGEGEDANGAGGEAGVGTETETETETDRGRGRKGARGPGGSRSGSVQNKSGSAAAVPGGGSGSGSSTPSVLRLQEGQGEDLVFETVNQLREQRRTMVQAEAQYFFIYEVLRKLWLDKYAGGGAGHQQQQQQRDPDETEVTMTDAEAEAEEEEEEEGSEGSAGEPAAKRLEVDHALG